MNLANITEITLTNDKADVPADVMSAVITEAEVHIPLDELVDFEAELERLTREKKKLEGEVKRGEKMLSNEGFISKAPEAKIQQEKDKLVNYKDMLAKVEERLDIIKNKTGYSPILLLDDVLAELDEIRQNYLLKSIETGVQTIITSVDTILFEEEFLKDVEIYRIENGSIKTNP
jgi:uncharacterized protein (UPF0335 family)